MKLGLVVPRYGEAVVGGTEHWLRTLCEHLVSIRGWEAEVFTTCAVSAETWADELPSGDTTENGVTVHRYRSLSGRDPAYLKIHARLRDDPGSLTECDARRMVELVGPVCPAVLDEAEGSDCDLIAVTPYLYWPAVTGVGRLGRRVIFHGAAHDEPELRLPFMKDVFGAVGGFAFNTFSEMALVHSAFAVGQLPAAVIGNAVEAPGEGDVVRARSSLGLEADEPFVLCLGKVERAKSAHLLASMWETYRRRRPGAPRLVLVGPVHEPVETSDGVVVAGRQPEPVKCGALRACDMLISPSALESFSLVLLEAWLSGKAVIVNGRCGPTVEQCRRSGGGLWFDQYGDFEAAVDLLLGDASLRQRLAADGRAYAEREFNWPTIADRYSRLAQRILDAFPREERR